MALFLCIDSKHLVQRKISQADRGVPVDMPFEAPLHADRRDDDIGVFRIAGELEVETIVCIEQGIKIVDGTRV